MTKLPQTETTVDKLYDYIAEHSECRHSLRIGASWIGTECDRAIWYKFRWAKMATFDGRMLRLFRTGKFAEDELSKDLRNTGATVLDADPDTGAQFFFRDVSGHFCGYMDGAGCGFVEAPATWHVIEYKTHNDKSFSDLEKNGVEKSKPAHYAQLQVYMGWSGMERALYVALNKNTDEIYIERVKYNAKDFKALRQRAKEIIFAIDPPERISDTPAFWKCKFCDFSAICHETGELAEKNCRTCYYSTAMEETESGEWLCERYGKTISTEEQKAACELHEYRECMVPDSVKRTAEAFGGKVIERKEDELF